jgi:dCMP deaminase
VHRIDWDQYALELAKTASIRSEDLYRKVGACALSHDNRVLGVAYNGLKAGKNVGDSFWQDRDERRPYVIHAESNLLSLFTKKEAKVIAVTLLPCSSCAKLICAWNIDKVIYNEEYDSEEAFFTKKIFDFYNIKLKKMNYLDK